MSIKVFLLARPWKRENADNLVQFAIVLPIQDSPFGLLAEWEEHGGEVNVCSDGL
jgi:hypothetical protein